MAGLVPDLQKAVAKSNAPTPRSTDTDLGATSGMDPAPPGPATVGVTRNPDGTPQHQSAPGIDQEGVDTGRTPVGAGGATKDKAADKGGSKGLFDALELAKSGPVGLKQLGGLIRRVRQHGKGGDSSGAAKDLRARDKDFADLSKQKSKEFKHRQETIAAEYATKVSTHQAVIEAARTKLATSQEAIDRITRELEFPQLDSDEIESLKEASKSGTAEQQLAAKKKLNDSRNVLNPYRMFEGEGGTTRKILAVIAAGFSGAAAGLQGRAAPDTIGRIIAADVQAQKAKWQALRGREQTANNLYGRLYGELKDEQVTGLALKEMAWKAILKEVDILNLEYGPVFDQMEREKFTAIATEEIAQAAQARKERSLALEGNLLSTKISANMQASQMANRGQANLTVPGTQVSGEKMPTEADAKWANDNRGQVVAGISALEDLKSFIFGGDGVEGVGGEWSSVIWTMPDSDNTKLAMTMMTNLMTQLKNKAFYDLGVLQKTDLVLLEKTLGGNPTNPFYQDNIEKTLTKVGNNMRKNWAAKLRQRGYTETEYPSQTATDQLGTATE